jgi:hypothetical protein
LNKLEKGHLRDYEAAFCFFLALMVLDKKIFKDYAILGSFSLPVQKLFGIPEPYEQILMRTIQGKFLPKISHLGVVVSEMFKKCWSGRLNFRNQTIPVSS